MGRNKNRPVTGLIKQTMVAVRQVRERQQQQQQQKKGGGEGVLGGVCVEGSDSHGPQRRNQGKRSDKQIPTFQAGEEQTGEELSTGGKQTELTFFADYLKSVIIFILSFSLLFFFVCIITNSSTLVFCVCLQQ